MKLNLLNTSVNSKPLNNKICELIKRRRRQIMVHSFIYYRMSETLITDKQFDKLSYELRDLQKEYPNESKNVELYEEFKDWDGTTGFQLEGTKFSAIAQFLINYNNSIEHDKDKGEN